MLHRPPEDEYQRCKQLAEDFVAKGQFKACLAAYRNKAVRLTSKQLDDLILDIAADRNSYAELRQRVPKLNSPTLMRYLETQPNFPEYMIGDLNLGTPIKTGEAYFKVDPVPEDYIAPYLFKDGDTFCLAVDGENRKYQLDKESLMLSNTLHSIKSADAAVKWAIIGIVVNVVLFLLGKALG